jgi:hypothetical protein
LPPKKKRCYVDASGRRRCNDKRVKKSSVIRGCGLRAAKKKGRHADEDDLCWYYDVTAKSLDLVEQKQFDTESEARAAAIAAARRHPTARVVLAQSLHCGRHREILQAWPVRAVVAPVETLEEMWARQDAEEAVARTAREAEAAELAAWYAEDKRRRGIV